VKELSSSMKRALGGRSKMDLHGKRSDVCSEIVCTHNIDQAPKQSLHGKRPPQTHRPFAMRAQ